MTLIQRSNIALLSALAAALVIPSAAAAQGFLDQILGPFGGLDVAGAYVSYSSLVDLIIYALLLTGIAHVTVGKRFEGRGGRAITVGVSLILTISLLLVERQTGFSIASFAPIAGGVIVVAMAGMLYLGIRHLGGGHAASGSLALIATYLSMRAATPGPFDWLAARTPFIHAALAAAVLVVIWCAVSALWPGSSRAVAETVVVRVAEVLERGDAGTVGAKRRLTGAPPVRYASAGADSRRPVSSACRI